jgi:alcohol dehydrogenase class IV
MAGKGREKERVAGLFTDNPPAPPAHQPARYDMPSTHRNFWNFYSAGRIVFGSGAVSRLSELMWPWNVRKIFVVSDRVLERVGVVGQVLRPLADAKFSISVFLDGEPEPSFTTAQKAIDAAWKFLPEAVIGVGGGSNIDLAKIVAVMLNNGGKLSDYAGYNRFPRPPIPLVCLPTTAGTGSEVSHAAVLTDADNQLKISFQSQSLRPKLALVDPKLTLTCPPKPTADSGIDALTHAIEAYTCVDFDKLTVPADEPFPYDGKNPIGDCLAERAIELIGKHLLTAVREPQNLVARERMSLAATLAGLAFSNCAVAAVHALEYPIGGALHCSHGSGNGLLLPYVMRFNLPVRSKEFAQIARLLGEDVNGLEDSAAAERAVVAVERLRSAIGIPARLRDLGGTREQLPEFARKAFQIKRLMLLNGRPPTEADLLAILEAAF